MLIKLKSEYDQMYRPLLKPRSGAALRREAQKGNIPGCLKFAENGEWWVDTETHDKEVQELIQMRRLELSAQDHNIDDALSPEMIDHIDSIRKTLSDAA